MSKPSYYLTTPIYYITDQPHIGTSYTTIAADALARYKRLCGYDVHFLTGTDEHGLKIVRAAQAKGVAPRELANGIVTAYYDAWERLGITYDDFIRTTEPRHERIVQLVYEKWHKAGDLYLGEYKGWYCVSCEAFLKETEEKQPKCPDCGRPAEWNSEPSYFFRLSKYQERLLKLYEDRPGLVKPASRFNEIKSRVKEGMRDLSVTRTTLQWGVQIPFDPAHYAYVWIDALINYISAIGYGVEEEQFKRRWPAQAHLLGKDILWFHAAIWPCMLMSLGLEPPELVFAHGWWTHNGEKMSKSKGNFVLPEQVAEEYSVDALRYFLLRELPFGMDGDYRDAAMLQRYNSELAGDLGNLLFRTLSMIDRYFDGMIPDPAAEPEGPLAQAVATVYNDVDEQMGELAFSRALDRIWEFVRRANQYVEERKPWQLAKDPAARPALQAVMYHLAEACRILGLLVEPVMPNSARAIREQLSLPPETRPLNDALAWGGLPVGGKVQRGAPLFPKKEQE